MALREGGDRRIEVSSRQAKNCPCSNNSAAGSFFSPHTRSKRQTQQRHHPLGERFIAKSPLNRRLIGSPVYRIG